MTDNMYHSIAVKHNIEVAHRLFETPGKCEAIHGHSMWVTMTLDGEKDSKGLLGGIEYGDLKKLFRHYLDETYDHRLLLNVSDPWARPLYAIRDDMTSFEAVGGSEQVFLPGLQSVAGDPTTENIAEWIATDMKTHLHADDMTAGLYGLTIEVWETSVNMAKIEVVVER